MNMCGVTLAPKALPILPSESRMKWVDLSPFSLAISAIFAGSGSLACLRRRIDGDPDDALGRVIGLEFLHVAGAVMLLHERAAEVDPFEDDDLALQFAERDGFAVQVFRVERGSGLADFGGGGGDERECSDDGGEEDGFHNGWLGLRIQC